MRPDFTLLHRRAGKKITFEVQAVQASVLEQLGSVQCTPTQTPSGQAAQALPILAPPYAAHLHWEQPATPESTTGLWHH